MLEIRHLTKIYKTKGGQDTKALDDVSIRFPETGLVFLLGKSGSGKSTLLNLAGGLDEPTSGEVIVMGKSSRDFSGSDFDSYRNTFIGFVFQEYNVLNEFNVAENVALALELQGRTKEHDKVMQILEEVELEQYAKRKPNTLSGGQKQRIAIARALVKDPQIIMADEPTGALDSATGKQVFDTLKKLSKSRLVLVVSHDREFAEVYGDRIVELKDGKIISDVTKVRDEAAALSDTVKQIGLDTLSVEAGATDDATMARIRSFLEESRGDVLISRGEREIASFRRANRIDDEGAQERFAETEEDKLGIKEYDGKDTRFVRSRLPAKKAIKIGASGLKIKPFRLVLTVFLSFVSFLMFGLFSTMMLYDPEEVLVQSFIDGDDEYLSYVKSYETRTTYNYNGDIDTWNYYNSAKFTPAELKALGGEDGFGVYEMNSGMFGNLNSGENTPPYYSVMMSGLGVLPEGHALRQTITGNYPTADDEICISNYLFECIKNNVFYPLGADDVPVKAPKSIQSEQDLIGEKLLLGGNTPLKVTGIFADGAIPKKFDPLKEEQSDGPFANDQLTWEYSSYLRSSLHAIGFTTEECAKAISSSNQYAPYLDFFEAVYGEYRICFREDEEGYYSYYEIAAFPGTPDPTLSFHRFDGKTTEALGEKELIVDLNLLSGAFQEEYYAWDKDRNSDPAYTEWLDRKNRDSEKEYPQISDFEGPDGVLDAAEQAAYEEALNAWNEKWNSVFYPYEADYYAANEAITLLSGWAYDELGRPIVPTAAEREEAIAKIVAFAGDPFPVLLSLQSRDNAVPTEKETYTVVGFYCVNSTNYESGLFTSQKFYDDTRLESEQFGYVRTEETKYVPESDAVYSYIYTPLVRNADALRAAFENIGKTDPETDIVYSIGNSLYSNVEMVNDLVDLMSLIFLIIGLVLMVFSALLLLNFITLSITNKTKEIGILRAVGARGTDVFKIFFSESGIIVGICLVLSLIGATITAAFLNRYLRAEVGLQATLFVFGVPSVAIMVGVALLVALIGTFLPVYFASRKKPVESIRAL